MFQVLQESAFGNLDPHSMEREASRLVGLANSSGKRQILQQVVSSLGQLSGEPAEEMPGPSCGDIDVQGPLSMRKGSKWIAQFWSAGRESNPRVQVLQT